MEDYSFGIIPFYWESDDAHYFLGRSATRDTFWKFPKGHKEDDESNIDAAIREVREEAGLHVRKEWIIDNTSFAERYEYIAENQETVQKTNIYYLAKLPYYTRLEVSLNEEFTEYRWVTYREALELLPENSRDFLKNAHVFLQEKLRE